MEKDILVFEIDERRFGIRAELVSEVVRAVLPMPLPRMPDVVMGIINLRGSVVPVIDTRLLLRLPPAEVRHTDHLLIILDGDLTYAIHADRAIDLAHLQSDEDGDEPEETDFDFDGESSDRGLIASTELGFVQILHPSELLDEAQRKALRSILSASAANEIRM